MNEDDRRRLAGDGQPAETDERIEAKAPAGEIGLGSERLGDHDVGLATALACCHRQSATAVQIASTKPNGHAPERNP